MKLYSRSQIFKAVISGVAAGFIICAAASFYLWKNYSPENNSASLTSNENSEIAGTENGSDESDKKEKIIVSDDTKKVSDFTNGYTLDESQNIYVYEKCNEAVVNITTQVMGYNWFFEPIIKEGGSGSGSIIDKRGYVVTNVHVIDGAQEINISLADGSTYPGKIIGKDVASDIAVLKFDPPEGLKLKTIEFENNEKLKVGQKVIAIGNPFALERTMTTGIISGLGRPIQESENVIIRNMIQTDAAINPGNSGGPLLDTKGNMIGINTMIMSNSGSSAGVGFAVPISTASRVVNDLLKYGKVNRGVLKFKPVQMTGRIANYLNIPVTNGILVSEVDSGSETEKSGLKGGTESVQYGSRFNPTTIYLGGDIIVAVDGIDTPTYASYTSALESKKPGDKVKVKIWRSRGYMTLTVTLDSAE